ncbi:uncharacterized protein LOC119724650 isoform X2 [Patiria miniata]|uniref:C2H2-type domain-containing protein n=1 Tax=Patiria miniata TaxID=46514 RepID=A0A913ZL03_PATMI|nr:uncharacterized protein LOC119724650 isoform X2 [Patiria miniata]
MEEESGVLGASGMLRQSPKDEDDEKTATSEKTSEEIDVEGDSDDEVQDVRPPSQEPQELEEKLEEADRSCPTQEVAVDENFGSGSVEKRSESGSPTDRQIEKQVCSPVEELQADASDKKLASGKTEQSVASEAKKTEVEKDHIPESKTTEFSEKVPESSSGETLKNPGDQQDVAKPDSDVLTIQEAPTVAQASEKIAERKTTHVPESKTTEFPEKVPESSLGETLKSPDDQQVVVAKTESDVKTVQKEPTVVQAKETIAELETKQIAKTQKLKSFEDAFKASLGKLNIEVPRRKTLIKRPGITLKPVDSASQRPPSETQQQRPKDSERITGLTDKGLNVMVPEKNETGPSSSSSSEKIPGGRPNASLDLTSSQKPARDNQKIEEDTSDDEGDNSRDVDNFSSDSSSTIIDIEMATKESTEEEIPGNLNKSRSTLQDQSSKEVLTDEVEKAKSRESNPTSDTRSRREASDKRMSSSTVPSRDHTRTRTIHRTHRTGVPTSVADKKQEIGSPSNTYPEKTREFSRLKSAARLRERSKSDESQNVLGKKYRISKHGIVLQPGIKLEAMDYSKKWYLARIVSVDETDSTVLIHFAGWNSRFDEWLEFDSDRLRPMARVSARRETAKEVKALGGYKVGDEVLARWSDCRYYPAKILGIKTNGSYRVLFYDGIEKIVMGINVRDMPDSLKSQQFFSNLEHQFRALLNKKRRGSKDAEESPSSSRPASPVQQPQKRRHPSASQTPATQPAKRSRQDSGRPQKLQKGYVMTTEPIPPSPTLPQEPTDLLPSPTSSEASELMSALEHGLMGNKKRYREPLIFDKTSGLIRDPRRIVAPKELVIDLDHNKYKCEVPDCGKAFRKASLLEYHNKYYHINKPATSTSAMTAAKNAVTRSRKRLSTSAMAPGSSKMRRTESLDVSPAKITSRPMRASAPSIMTASYKRPLPSPKLESPAETARPPKTIPMSSQFLKKPEVKQPLPTLRSERPAVKLDPAPPPPMAPTLPAPKTQGSEVIAKVVERSRRVSGSSVSKEDKPSTSKWEVVTTTIVEKPEAPPKAATPTPEVKIKTEPGVAPPAQKPETKLEESGTTNKNTEVKGQIQAPTEVTEVAAVKAEVPKKARRNKPHKKHKRHKARGRDRRSREQSRSERRRAAERAKQRRLEQRQLKEQFEASAAAAQKPEDVTEWTAKYLPITTGKNVTQSPAQSSDDPAAKPEAVDSSTTEDGGPRDMISCICRNQEEEGFMIQCETCYGWQHGRCVGLTEHTVPKQYICSFCIYPENLRTHARHRYDQEWFRTGRLPTLTQPAQPEEESSDLTDSMLKTHQLMADMINVTEALDGLQRKLEILKSDNHPDLKLWSHHWGLKDESTPLDDSAHSQQLQTSLEESDIHLTSADTSALTESMRSDVVIDSIAAEEVVMEVAGTGTSDANVESGSSAVGNRPDGGVACEMGQPQEGDKPMDGPNSPGASIQTSIPETRNQDPQKFGSDSVDTEASPMEVDTDKPLETSLSMQATKSKTEQNIEVGGGVPIVPDNSAPMSSKPQESQAESAPAEKSTACIVPDPEPSTTQGAKGGVTNEGGKPGIPVHDGKLDSTAKNVINDKTDLAKNAPTIDESGIPIQTTEKKDSVTGEQGELGAPKHHGKADGVAKQQARTDGNSSDDEPLIKYSKKTATSSETESESTSTAAKTTTPPLPQPSPAAVPVLVDISSSGQTVPASICKLNLFNHIVCVEEELKRRMDYVEEQIEALELAFNQSAGSKDSPYVPPDSLKMKQTISTLMVDLERVNKLVSI